MARRKASDISVAAGRVLGSLRRQAGIKSQKALAAKIERSRQWTQLLESGRAELDLKTLENYAAVFGVSEAALLTAIRTPGEPDLASLQDERARRDAPLDLMTRAMMRGFHTLDPHRAAVLMAVLQNLVNLEVMARRYGPPGTLALLDQEELLSSLEPDRAPG